jgi:hypothetical protein
LSKYSDKKARQAAEALLDPTDDDLQALEEAISNGDRIKVTITIRDPEEHADGLGEVPALDTFTPEQKTRYDVLVKAWQAESCRIHPGSKARRLMRATVLREVQ